MAMGKIQYISLIGVLVLLFYGCEKENGPCETAKQGENYVLSDSSKTYLKNYENAKKIIFKSPGGEEFILHVIKKDTNARYEGSLPCEADTSRIQIIKGTSQIINYTLSNSSLLSKPLQVSLFKLPEILTHYAEESLIVSFGERFSSQIFNIDELFYYVMNTDNSQLIYHDSLVLGGKTFYQVFDMGGMETSTQFEIKYTKQEGIIYLKDKQRIIEYRYDRKE